MIRPLLIFHIVIIKLIFETVGRILHEYELYMIKAHEGIRFSDSCFNFFHRPWSEERNVNTKQSKLRKLRLHTFNRKCTFKLKCLYCLY